MSLAGPVSKANAEHYVWGGDCDGWRLVDRKGLSVIHERMLPGRSEVRHFHRRARQLFFVLSGELTIEMDGVRHTLGPHTGLEIPPEAAHQAINAGEVAVEFLVISQPTTTGDREPA